jgi:hypothetical protein
MLAQVKRETIGEEQHFGSPIFHADNPKPVAIRTDHRGLSKYNVALVRCFSKVDPHSLKAGALLLAVHPFKLVVRPVVSYCLKKNVQNGIGRGLGILKSGVVVFGLKERRAGNSSWLSLRPNQFERTGQSEQRNQSC